MVLALISLAAMLLLNSSCVSKLDIGEEPAKEKKVYFCIHYYPYTVSMVRTTATPVNNFKDWNMARMNYDLDAIGSAGIDIVIVSINPEEISVPKKVESYLEFIKIAGSKPEYPNVAFMAECHGASKEQIAEFLKWCEDQNFEKSPGYFKYRGKPLVEIYDAVNDKFASSEKLCVRHTVWCQEWYWGVAKSADKTELSKNGEQAMVFAGFLKNGDKGPSEGWSLDRKSGETLRERLDAALKLNPKFVCIASWNDYWEGHFIEPNSLDSSSLYNVLKKEIAKAKK